MGLRLRQGVGLQGLENRYDLNLTEVYGDTVQKLIDGGLLLMSNTHLRLSERGWAVANLVMSELV
jgi:coproporphyrinogen III oxidase-like Fe-S oxidoreductase